MRRFYSGLFFFSLLATAYTSTASASPNYYNPYDYNDEIVDQKFVHRYGVTMPRYHWEETGKNGQVVSTTKFGVLCSQNFYLGKLEGESTYSFPFSDNIEKVELYSQDQLLKETTFYLNGRPKKEIVYNPSEHTKIREWYENGQIKSYEKYAGNKLAYAEYYDLRGNRISGIDNGSGVRTLRDKYGIMVFTDTFNDGKAEYRTTYYPNGAPYEVTPYKNGIVEGLRKTYYQGGEPKTIETWASGQQHGITTVFVDGQRSHEIPYVGGVKTGVGKVYKDGDILMQEQTWKDDKLHGPCYTYVDERSVTDWYYKGNKVSKGYYDSFAKFTPHDN